MENQSDYDAGLRDGRLTSLEKSHAQHSERLNDHAKRISSQERITYSLLGAIGLVQLWPSISNAINTMLGGG